MYGSLNVNYLFIVGNNCFTIIYRIAEKFGKLTLQAFGELIDQPKDY